MSPQPLRTDNLALAFQELITVGERLRCNRQMVADAASFRAQIWAALKTASDQARNRGYPQEDIELATFAVIAFVDESILNLRHPIFADWPRQPLQEERYGHHVAGEIFFQNLQKLLLRNDSAQLADLLEVYYLCLMLGFAGRYSLGGRSELMAIMQQTADKLQRIRQTSTILSPDCQPPGDPVRRVSGDSVARALLFVAIGCAILTITLFIVFYVTLGKGVDSLQKTARNTDFSLSWSLYLKTPAKSAFTRSCGSQPCGVGLWPARDAQRRSGPLHFRRPAGVAASGFSKVLPCSPAGMNTDENNCLGGSPLVRTLSSGAPSGSDPSVASGLSIVSSRGAERRVEEIAL
jgi:type VI secretion system protein ImpK